MQVIFSTQSSSVQTANCCRTTTQIVYRYFKTEIIRKTDNKTYNWFHQRKAAEGGDGSRDQPGTVRLVSSYSRPGLLIGGRLVGWFLRLVLLAPVVISCSTQSCPQKEKSSITLLMMQPRGRSQNGQRVALRKAIDTNIRGVIPSSRSSTQVAFLTCGARGENHAHEFLHLLLHSRPLGCSCCGRRRCFLSLRTSRRPRSSTAV